MNTNPKARLIKLVHVARRQLQLDETLYRQMLKGFTGKDSLRAMNVAELEMALEGFKKKGFKVVSKARQSGSKRRYSQSGHKLGTVDKIQAIWITMANQGFVHDGSPAALDAYVRRMTLRGQNQGVDSVRFLDVDRAEMVLEALKGWHRREMVQSLEARNLHRFVPRNLRGHLAHYDAVCEAYAGFERGAV